MIRTFLFIFLFFYSFCFYGQKGQLKIVITNIDNKEGNIKVAIYSEQNKEGFLKDLNLAAQKKMILIKDKTLTVIFSDIQYGTYAVSLFHDKNNNSELDRATLGYPIEPYGVSGNKKTLGPPRFEDCMFNFDSSLKTINIEMTSYLKNKQP